MMFDWTVTVESREFDQIRLYDEDDGICKISQLRIDKAGNIEEETSISVRPEILIKMLEVFVTAQNKIMDVAKGER